MLELAIILLGYGLNAVGWVLFQYILRRRIESGQITEAQAVMYILTYAAMAWLPFGGVGFILGFYLELGIATIVAKIKLMIRNKHEPEPEPKHV